MALGNGGDPVAVLGVTGFIGRHLASYLAEKGIPAVGIARREVDDMPIAVTTVADFSDHQALAASLRGRRRIVHLADEAGRFASHGDTQPVAVALARAIAGTGRRLIFASSIYSRLNEEGASNPYGARKRQQEEILLSTGRAIGLRLPPVYGEGCGGSFALLRQAVSRGVPLPFSLATAQRSYLSIGNLCSLIGALLLAPEEAWERTAPALYEPEDQSRISTRELALAFGRQCGRPAKLIPVSRSLLAVAARMTGRQALVSGAFDELCARDNPALDRLFGWRPSEGLPGSLSNS